MALHPGGYASAAPSGVRAMGQPTGGEAGRSHAKGSDARRGLVPPAAANAMISATAPAPTAESPTTARVRRIVLHVPVAVARTAVVVGVSVTATVLGNPAFGRRFRLRGGRRLGRGFGCGLGRFWFRCGFGCRRLRRGLWRLRLRRRRGMSRARAGVRARRVPCLVVGYGHREPRAAESHYTLPVGLARIRVLYEPIQRVAVVDDLGRSVGPLAGPQKRGVHTRRSRRRAGGHERWPRRGAGTTTAARRTRVVGEQGEGATLR